MAVGWETAYCVLDDVSPVGYKLVSAVHFKTGESGARWIGDKGETSGTVIFFPDADPRSIAHEIGEGFGERLNSRYGGDINNSLIHEDLAEAIRFFVETRMGASAWRPHDNHRRVLEACSWDEKIFASQLRDESLIRYLQAV
jgi:hypothetical protein